MSLRARSFVVILIAGMMSVRAAFSGPASDWVYYGPDGTLQYKADSTGAKILNYSAVGYQNGTQNIPYVNTNVVTINPSGGDDSAAVQAAINTMSSQSLVNGFRGVLSFGAGTFHFGSPLTIQASGIVLRGAGQGPIGTTFLATYTTTNDLITVSPTGSTSFSRGSNPSLTITDQYVPVGATSFNLSATTGLAVGNKIIVQRPSTQKWIDDIGMGAAGLGTEAWSPNSSFMQTDRTITAINGNTITINAGLTTAIDSRTIDGISNAYGGGTVWEYTTNRVSNVGIENIRFDTTATSSTDMNHAGRPISFSGVNNSWVRNTTAIDYYNGIYFGSKSEFDTSQDNLFRDPAGDTHSGGHALDGQWDLIQRDTTFNAHAPFVSQDSNTVGPDVFVFGTANASLQSIGPHQRWASGVLWDNMKVTGNAGIELVNRGNFGSGQGWAGANMQTWNSQAPWSDVEMPPTAQNWAIGTITPNRRTNFNGAEGIYDSFGTRVSLNSLYIAQLKQALGPRALPTANHLFSVGPNTNFTGPSVTPYVDPAWLAIAQSGDLVNDGSSATIVGFDNATASARRAATIQYSLASGETVVAATLTAKLQAISNLSSTDTFFINTPGAEFDFDMLGMLPWNAGDVRTISIDLSDIYGPLLAPLQTDALGFGNFNLFFNGNVNVDFAQLNLSTTGIGAANATRTWNGGSSTDSNATSNANWTTNVAPKVGDSLVFDGNARLTPNNDLPSDTILGGITFNAMAGSFTLSGNSITLGGNITDNSTNPQTINLSIRPDTFRTVTVATGGQLTIGGVITGSNGIVKAGAGTLVLSASNTFTGGLFISGGKVQLNNAGALNSASPMDVTFGPNAAAGTTLTLNGNSITITGLNTSTPAGSPVVENASGTAALLTINTTAENTFAGTIQNGTGGGGSAALSLNLTGGGKLALTGTNSYTGITRIFGSTIEAGPATSFVGLSGQVRFANITIDSVTYGGTIHVTDPGGNHLVVAAGTNNKFTTVGQSGATGTFDIDSGVTLQVGALDGSGQPTSTTPALQTAGTGPDGGSAGSSFIKTGLGTLRVVSQNNQQDTNFQLQEGTVDLWYARGLGGADSTSVQLNMSNGTTLMLTQDTDTNFLTYLRSNDATGSINIVINRLTTGAGVTHTFGALQSTAGDFTMHVSPGANISSGIAGFTLPSATLGGNATFDILNGGAVSTNMTITGVVSGTGFGITKTGAGTLTLSGAGTFTGNIAVNAGMLVANTTTGASNGSTGPLGNTATAGRTVTVASGATLELDSNNVFGGTGNALANMPAVTVNGGMLNATRYNQLGNITLNAATLSQSVTDTGNYNGYQFLGTVTVGGTVPSTISTGNAKADHLGSNTTFNVADVTGNANVDLTVSAPLRNQSGDYGLAAGALTKSGLGTMSLTAANTYSGGTTVAAGTLIVAHPSALGTGNLAVNAGAVAKLQAGLSTPVQLPALTIAGGAAPTATLDMTDNNLVLHNGDLATVSAQISSGLNNSGLLWGGSGITSSTAAADAAAHSNATVFAVGAIKNIDKNNNLICSTWPASPSPDGGASGLVDNTTDYDLWSNGFTNPGLAATNGWLYGDFDFSGIVDNTTDYDLWSTGLTHQGGPLAGGAPTAAQTDVQSVPEPSAALLTFLGLAGIAAVWGSSRPRGKIVIRRLR
jgi:autotransporter-associated beta strand protein